MILCHFISLRHLLFTWKTHCSFRFHIAQVDRGEICTEVSFTYPEVMWTLIRNLLFTEVKLYPKLKCQTGSSSLRASCKRGLKFDSTDPLTICIHLRTTDRNFHDQGNFRHVLSKLLKCDLAQTLNTIWNPSLRMFAARKASLV